MPSPPFESLRERLLRSGVAPRHVRRFLRELHDHYEDALRVELTKGTDPTTASNAAWSRLGTEESLAHGMLQRPELRSTAARFPALVFGVGPVFTWLGVPLGLAIALSLLPADSRRGAVDAAFIDAYHALCFLYTRLLPLLLGAVALEMAARHRLRASWPLIGAGIVDVLAGTVTVYAFPGQLGVTSSLLPWLLPFSTVLGPRDGVALSEGLLRGAALLILSLILQRLLRRFGNSDRLSHAVE
ncbi:MAG: hypothetical protein RL033_784 [Pseudomonadota bacterium]|jgi:hypothetical protein